MLKKTQQKKKNNANVIRKRQMEKSLLMGISLPVIMFS